MGPLLVRSSIRSNLVPATLHPVRPRMTRTTRADFQEKVVAQSQEISARF
jgi:hypothetical protein